MQLSLFALCAISAFVFVGSAKEVPLPPEFKSCKRTSEDFSSCLRLALQESWPTLVKGIPELELPPLEPFETNLLETIYRNGDVRGKVTVKNARTYGISKIRFLSVKPQFDGNRFNIEVDVEMPKILIEGEYKGEGFLSAFKIGGKGQFNVSAEGIRTYYGVEGRIENDRWVIEHFKPIPEVTKMQIWFSDLFNGNQELNKAALLFTNEYWPVLYRGMLPYVSQAMDRFLTESTNRVFSKISISQLFP